MGHRGEAFIQDVFSKKVELECLKIANSEGWIVAAGMLAKMPREGKEEWKHENSSVSR
jgi:hypothetical protein